jgi:hypothetical protein
MKGQLSYAHPHPYPHFHAWTTTYTRMDKPIDMCTNSPTYPCYKRDMCDKYLLIHTSAGLKARTIKSTRATTKARNGERKGGATKYR